MYYEVLDEYHVCEKCGDEKFPTYKVFTTNENNDVFMFCTDCNRKFFMEMEESERRKYTALIYEQEIITKFYQNAGDTYFMPSEFIPHTQVLFKILSRNYISNTIEYNNIYEYLNQFVLSLIYNKEEFKQEKYKKGIFGLQFVFNLYEDNSIFDNNRLLESDNIYFDYLNAYH